MRLANIGTKDQANDFLISYLPKHNLRFTVPAQASEDFHQPVPKHINLDQILSSKVNRRLKNDSTISYKGNLYLIEDMMTTKTITVEKRSNG